MKILSKCQLAAVVCSDNRADVNIGGFQPFLFYQLGAGTYLRSSAVMTYSFENDTYSVPVGPSGRFSLA